MTVIERQFDANPGYWRDVYADPGLAGQVYRLRLQVALKWIGSLALPPGAAVLDAGCGAGALTLELARRGLSVTALDASQAMLALTRQALATHGSLPAVALVSGDVAGRLPFEDECFSLIGALGLLPWIAAPDAAVLELARVLEPGGWLLLSADNIARLNFVTDPRESPLLAPLKQLRGGLRRALGSPPEAPDAWRHRPAQVDAMLRAAGLAPLRRETVGFGPFTFMGRAILPDRAGAALHARLERRRLASPTLRRCGWHYLVLARLQRRRYS